MLSLTFAFAKEPDAPVTPVLIVKNDCIAAIALAARKDGMSYTESFNKAYNEKYIADACTLLVRAEQGDKGSIENSRYLSADKKQTAEECSRTAKSLRQAADQGEIGALVVLQAAKADTNQAEYLKHFYKYFNIEQPSNSDFPLTIFDSSKTPLPSDIRNVYWIDDTTVVYNAYEKQPAPIGQGQFYAGLTVPISLNLKTLSKEHLSQELFEEVKEANPEYRFLYADSGWCQKIFPWNVRACYKTWDETEPARRNAKSKGYADTFDPKIIFIKKDSGEVIKLVFDEPIFPPNFGYDKFSKQYWVGTDEKIWRYDENFNFISVSTYQKGWWVPARCFASHWSYSWKPACESLGLPLKYSTRYGFLIVKDFQIHDSDNREIKRFNAGGIFLTTPLGKIYKLTSNQLLGSGFSISPDGCHALFKTNIYNTQNLAMIELCSFFKKPE